MKRGERIYILVSTWGCYSDYVEKILLITDDKKTAFNEADNQQRVLNAKTIADQISDGFSKYNIDVDTQIVLRSYPFNQSLNELTKAEREAYYIDEEVLYEAKEVTGEIDNTEISCYLLKTVED